MAGWSIPGVVHPREIGEDSVGRRVVARHRMTRRSLAITYLSPELLADTEFRTRFARDFARLARVRDTRVARVHRYVEGEHGAAVIGDRVNGTALRALLLAHGAVGTEAALVVLKDLLLALAACHEAGLAHGDVKPEDVVVTSTGRVRLVDSGLWTSGGRRLLGRSTPFYLAPEHWSDRPATSAGDVYAATATFFECLVGAPPFYAEGVAELSIKHQSSAAPVDVVPAPVRDLMLRGLAKDPVSRSGPRNLLADVRDVAGRAIGSDWERRGRRELATLLGGRRALTGMSALAGMSALGRRSNRAGWADRKPVRLAAVMGGALALAAGLSSPPLAVILPGISMFTPGGSSPVLAFPEPDQSAAPVRVVTNGPLADRMLSVKAGTGTPVAKSRPPAQSIPAPNIYPVPYRHLMADALAQGSADPDRAVQRHSTSTQSAAGEFTSTRECAHDLIDPGTCSAIDPERPTADSDATEWDPSQVIPASLSTVVEVPVQQVLPVKVPVQQVLPVKVPVQLPTPIQVPKSTPVQKKIHAGQVAQAPKDARIKTDSQGWKDAPYGPGATGKTDYPTNRAHGDSESSARGDSGFSGHDNPGSSEHGNSGSSGNGNSQSSGHQGSGH
ncbi:MAG: protein kinase [Actinomycetota bacterium]|nr:protein kinase [Actinomycetota bacterium]